MENLVEERWPAQQTPVDLAFAARKKVLEMVHKANASHVGSCLSCVDILAALYARDGGWLEHDPRQPRSAERDRFIMSKGHAAAALYATLSLCGYFPDEWLDTYCEDGSRLGGHCTSDGVPGVELSTGSLGHGLPVGVGVALGLKKSGNRVVVLLSDGELNEGSNWESILLAPKLELDNLIVVVDYNKIQSLGRVEDVIPLEPMADKWKSFGWGVQEVDGHNIAQIMRALDRAPNTYNRPTVILAHTVKGKGVEFMEDKLAWHYKSPNDEQLESALVQIEAAYNQSVMM